MSVDDWATLAMFVGLALVVVAGLRSRTVLWAREPAEPVRRARWLAVTATAVGGVLAVGGCAVLVLGGVLGTGG